MTTPTTALPRPSPPENRVASAGRQLRDSGPPAASVTDLTLAFGDHAVLDNISLAVSPGQVFGLIGPSGCGKTSLIKVLVGLLAPTSGEATVLGVDPARFKTKDRERIGYTPQGFVLYPTLTVYQNAKFVAGLYGINPFRRGRRIRDILSFLEIWDARNRLAQDTSGGMQRRLSLACALFHRPSIVFVDEPTAGLDPVLRAKIWEHLRALRDRGTTIVLSTQYIDEAEYCDNVAILNKGTVVAEGSPDELRTAALGGEALDVEGESFSRSDIQALWNLDCVDTIRWNGKNELRVMVHDAATATPAVTQALADRGVSVTAVRPYLPSFEEVFIELVRHK